MIYDEEVQSRKLYEILTVEILETMDEAEISIEGIGVHWHCMATLKELDCRFDCMGSYGYVVSFNRHGVTKANGRTKSEDQAISSAIIWLQNGSLEEMYRLFDFIDYSKRALSNIKDAFATQYPDCASSIQLKLEQNFAGNFHLNLESKDRFCNVYFWGEDEMPTSEFYWDGCMLFNYKDKASDSLLSMIKLWLYDYSMPSQLETKFPNVIIGKLAKYYEEGRGIEGEFILSWDHIEEFYKRRNRYILRPHEILKMIAQLRTKGYDKTLRAGQSMFTFIVSRARRHGHMTQYIAFDFLDKGMKVTVKLDTEQELFLSNIELTSQVEELLKHLESKDLESAPQFLR